MGSIGTSYVHWAMQFIQKKYIFDIILKKNHNIQITVRIY